MSASAASSASGRRLISPWPERGPRADRTYIVDDRRGPPAWWTFAGFAANSGLAAALPAAVDQDAAVSELRLRLRPGISAKDLRHALDAAGPSLTTTRAEVTDEAVSQLKFSAAVPVALARETLAERLADAPGVAAASAASIREHHR
jgi:ATP-dependent helicase Lhr and Lhr-like helicase